VRKEVLMDFSACLSSKKTQTLLDHMFRVAPEEGLKSAWTRSTEIQTITYLLSESGMLWFSHMSVEKGIPYFVIEEMR
jgi:hypothetical protein